jgi:hypothetical protein
MLYTLCIGRVEIFLPDDIVDPLEDDFLPV